MLKVTITKTGLAAIGRNGYRDVGRKAIKAAAMLWYTKYMPLHFQQTALRRYRYEHRDPRTNELKRERRPWPFSDLESNPPAIGEVKPLVFSGRSREAAMAGPNVNAISPNHQKYEATVVINARAFNFGAGKRIDMRDEVTRFTPQEESAMEKEFAREWERQLEKRGQSARTTKRIAA